MKYVGSNEIKYVGTRRNENHPATAFYVEVDIFVEFIEHH